MTTRPKTAISVLKILDPLLLNDATATTHLNFIQPRFQISSDSLLLSHLFGGLFQLLGQLRHRPLRTAR